MYNSPVVSQYNPSTHCCQGQLSISRPNPPSFFRHPFLSTVSLPFCHLQTPSLVPYKKLSRDLSYREVSPHPLLIPFPFRKVHTLLRDNSHLSSPQCKTVPLPITALSGFLPTAHYCLLMTHYSLFPAVSELGGISFSTTASICSTA